MLQILAPFWAISAQRPPPHFWKISAHTTQGGGAAASSKNYTAEWRFFAPDFPLHLNWQEALLPSVKKSRNCHTQHSTSLTKKGAIVCFFFTAAGTREIYSYVLIKFSAPCAQYVRLSIWENALSSYLVNNVKDDSEISPAYATRLPFPSFPYLFPLSFFHRWRKYIREGKANLPNIWLRHKLNPTHIFLKKWQKYVKLWVWQLSFLFVDRPWSNLLIETRKSCREERKWVRAAQKKDFSHMSR